MLHMFILILLVLLVLWLHRQVPGFRQPVQPAVIVVLLVVAVAVLAWVWVGSPTTIVIGKP